MVRKARQRRVAGEEGGEGGEGGGGGGKKKKKKRATICELNGWQWEASEKFDIERIIDSKVETYGGQGVRALTLAPALAYCHSIAHVPDHLFSPHGAGSGSR